MLELLVKERLQQQAYEKELAIAGQFGVYALPVIKLTVVAGVPEERA
jgi:hypothetical protein